MQKQKRLKPKRLTKRLPCINCISLPICIPKYINYAIINKKHIELRKSLGYNDANIYMTFAYKRHYERFYTMFIRDCQLIVDYVLKKKGMNVTSLYDISMVLLCTSKIRELSDYYQNLIKDVEL
jgi:hypothetical protein